MVRLPTEGNVLNRNEAAHEQAGHEEKNKGQGDFGNDDGIAQARFGDRSAETFAGASQSVLNVDVRGLKSREEAKDNNRCDSEADAEEKDPSVHFNDGFRRNGKGGH